MNHAQLKAFHAVATHGSFTKAARILHVTQPTLSDHVKTLEKRYGVKLFERRGRGVVLTGLGRALLQVTQRQFSLESEAEQLLARAEGQIKGRLRVAADGPYLIVPLLGLFCKRHPDVELTVRFGNSQEVTASLLELRADIGVMPENHEQARLTSLPLFQDRLIAFVDRDHAWARRRSIKLKELQSQRIIIREKGSGTRALIEQALQRQKVKPASSLEIGSREGVREAVAARLGIGIINESEFGSDRRLHGLIIRDTALPVTETIAFLKEASPVPIVRAFVEFIQHQRQ